MSAGSLASFVTDKRYELILPASLRKTINSPKNDAEKQIVAQLPDEIIEAAKRRKNYPLIHKKLECSITRKTIGKDGLSQ